MHFFYFIAIILLSGMACTNSGSKTAREYTQSVNHRMECPMLEKREARNTNGNTERYLFAAAENAYQQLELAELAVNNPETRQTGILMKEDYHDILGSIHTIAAHVNVKIPEQINPGDRSSVDAISKEPNQKFTRIYDLLLKQNLVNMTRLYEAAYYNNADHIVLQLLEATLKKLAISHMGLQRAAQTAML